MANWRPQQFLRAGKNAGIDQVILDHAAEIGRRITNVDAALTPVFTLRHLADLASVDYGFLRAIVRRRIPDAYRIFAIRKSRSEPKTHSFRTICVPSPALMRVQRWIAKFILAHGAPHSASHAYAPGSSILDAAAVHCGCAWLIKMDARRFFESVSEIVVYRSFRAMGYQPLISFELSRICTRLDQAKWAYRREKWLSDTRRSHRIPAYQSFLMGHLAQGAPSSPMLSNLCMVKFDTEVEKIALNYRLTYTRYADDISLSTPDKSFGRSLARTVIGEVYAAMIRHGLSPNSTKTKVCPPGSRKVVLGLLVDRNLPHLTREFRSNLRRHIHYLLHPEVGPSKHAAARGFESLRGMRNHIEGLVSFARQVDPGYAAKCDETLSKVAWPL